MDFHMKNIVHAVGGDVGVVVGEVKFPGLCFCIRVCGCCGCLVIRTL